MFRFPYDKQTCHLEFGSVVEPETVVNVSTDVGVWLYFYTPSNEFHLESSQAYRTTWEVGYVHSKRHLDTHFVGQIWKIRCHLTKMDWSND